MHKRSYHVVIFIITYLRENKIRVGILIINRFDIFFKNRVRLHSVSQWV